MARTRIFTVICFGMLLLAAGHSSAADKISVAGSGGMIPLVTELAKGFMSERPGVTVEVNQQSIESTGGIMSAAQGKSDIGMTARPLKADEQPLGLSAFEIARVATVVGVHRNVTARDISSNDLCRVYEGKISSWKSLGGSDAAIMTLTRPDRDATKTSVRKGISCFADLQEAKEVVTVATAPEMAKILSSRPDTIGFTDMVAVENSGGAIIALRLDGVVPSQDNVRSGRYKVVKTNILVTKGEPQGVVKEFIDFVRGPKGSKIIEENKAVAVR